MHSFSANQTRVIFSCSLLMILLRDAVRICILKRLSSALFIVQKQQASDGSIWNAQPEDLVSLCSDHLQEMFSIRERTEYFPFGRKFNILSITDEFKFCYVGELSKLFLKAHTSLPFKKSFFIDKLKYLFSFVAFRSRPCLSSEWDGINDLTHIFRSDAKRCLIQSSCTDLITPPPDMCCTILLELVSLSRRTLFAWES